jgi:hypothetical protein
MISLFLLFIFLFFVGISIGDGGFRESTEGGMLYSLNGSSRLAGISSCARSKGGELVHSVLGNLHT